MVQDFVRPPYVGHRPYACLCGNVMRGQADQVFSAFWIRPVEKRVPEVTHALPACLDRGWSRHNHGYMTTYLMCAMVKAPADHGHFF